MTKKKKKKWIIGIGIGVVLIAGGSYGFSQYQTHAKAEEEEQAFQNKQDQLAEQVKAYKREAATFYLNGKKELLASNVTKADVVALERQLHALEGQKMRVETAEKLDTATVDTAYASKMVALRNQVNGLLDKNGALAEKANVTQAEKQALALKEAKPVFYEEQTKIIQQAKQQQTQIKKANQAVDALFTDTERKTVKPNVTRAQFQTALTEKNKVKQPKVKQAMIQDLNRVENYLTTQEKQAAKQQAQALAQAKEEIRASQKNNQLRSRSGSSTPPSQGESSNGSSSSVTSKANGNGSSAPKSSYTAPRSSGQGNTTSSAGKSSSSSNQQPNRSQTSGGNPTKGGSTNKNQDSETTWSGEKHEQGYIDGEDGNTWGTIDW